MEKYYTINEEKHSIRCKIMRDDPKALKTAVIFGHGFGGHKDNKAAARFAERLMSKNKASALITFDWPCHGEDARNILRLEECDDYLRLVVNDTRTRLGAEELYGYAVSFGGYLFLKYIAENGSPFKRTALRCPAVTMADSLENRIMTAENRLRIQKNKPVDAGFDRKVRIDAGFLEELKQHDLFGIDFLDYAEDILILHGDKDEIIPYDRVRAFADSSLITMISVPGADHRFSDPALMDRANNDILRFFGLK